MISDPILAKRVSDEMLDIFVRVDKLVAAVREGCPTEQATAFTKATAQIAGGIVMDVLEPLYEKHPQFKPANWD